jgi:hypothetical protein
MMPPSAMPGAPPSGLLDGPPPNPMLAGPLQMPGAMGGGMGAPASRSLPPEQLMGLMQAGKTISEMIDSMASMVPDLAPDLAFAKEGLQRFLAKVLLAGGGPTTSAQAGIPMPNGLPTSPSPSV